MLEKSGFFKAKCPIRFSAMGIKVFLTAEGAKDAKKAQSKYFPRNLLFNSNGTLLLLKNEIKRVINSGLRFMQGPTGCVPLMSIFKLHFVSFAVFFFGSFAVKRFNRFFFRTFVYSF